MSLSIRITRAELHSTPGELPAPAMTAVVTWDGRASHVDVVTSRGRRVTSRARQVERGGEGRTNRPTKCGACGTEGHIRSNKLCPLRGGA